MANEADLLIEAGYSDAKLARDSAKVIGMFKQAGEKAEKAFQSAVNSVAGSEKVKATAREMEKLKREFDPLYAASKRYEAQLTRLSRGQEVGALSAKQYAVALDRLNAEFSGGAEGAAVAGRKFGGSLQQVGFQIGDFATQVGAGTSATQALGQQLPQLLGAFGTFGALAGAAAAVLIPLGAALLKTAFDSETLEDRLKELTASTDAMADAADLASTPLSDLRAQYGELADEVQRANAATAGFTAVMARRNLIGTAQKTGTELFGGAFEYGQTGVSSSEEDVLAAVHIARLARQLGVAKDQAKLFDAALRELERAKGPDDVVAATERLLTMLVEIKDPSDEVKAAIVQIGALGQEAARQIAATHTEAQRMADKYAGTTRELRKLAEDRAAAEKALATAQAQGNDQLIADLLEVRDNIDAQIERTKELAVVTDEAFGRMARAMNAVLGASASEGFNALGEKLGNMGAPYAGEMAAAAKDIEAANKGLRELIKLRESGGDYNVTLDHGAYTGGPRDLVNMTVNEVLAMQKGMLAHPDNKKNSSAAGAYQIVRTTLLSLVDELGLTGSELYDQGLQDRLADQLIRRRRGQGNAGLRSEWEGLGPVPDAILDRARAQGGVSALDPEIEGKRQTILQVQVRERERLADSVKKYGEQLAANLLTEQQTTEVEARRAQQIAAINASGGTEADKAAAIAAVNGEMERQITIMALIEEAKRRQVDLDALMVGSTMTYRDAIQALGDTAKAKVIADQQMQASAQSAAEAQEFMASQTRQLEDGLVDAIVSGENFADVLKNVAAQMAKAALQAALFGSGPLGGQAGGGLLAGAFQNGGFLSKLFGGFRADGGTIDPGKFYVAGERGPEIIVPRSPGQVIPNHKIGSGSNVNIVIDVRGANGNTEIQRMVAAGVEQGMAQVRREVPGIMESRRTRAG